MQPGKLRVRQHDGLELANAPGRSLEELITWSRLVLIQQNRDELRHGVLAVLATDHILEAEACQLLAPGLFQEGCEAGQLAADEQAHQEACLACSADQPCDLTQPAAQPDTQVSVAVTSVCDQAAIGVFDQAATCLFDQKYEQDIIAAL